MEWWPIPIDIIECKKTLRDTRPRDNQDEYPLFDPADFKHSHQIITMDEFKQEFEDLR